MRNKTGQDGKEDRADRAGPGISKHKHTLVPRFVFQFQVGRPEQGGGVVQLCHLDHEEMSFIGRWPDQWSTESCRDEEEKSK